MREIHIQSISDVITNSSSEIFLIETDMSPKEVYEEILSWKIPMAYSSDADNGEHSSGMGGDIVVIGCDSTSHNNCKWGPEPAEYLGNNHVSIDIDWSRKVTIATIFKKFKVVDCQECNLVIDKKTKRGKRLYYNDYDNKIDPETEEVLSGSSIYYQLEKDFYENKLKEIDEDIQNHCHNQKYLEKVWPQREYTQNHINYLNSAIKSSEIQNVRLNENLKSTINK